MTTVLTEQLGDGVVLVTLNRPERLNAMNPELVRELGTVLAEIGEDLDQRVVVLTGAGRGFCAGLDLDTLARGTSVRDGAEPEPAAMRKQGRIQGAFVGQKQIAGLITQMRNLPQPIVAAVNGPAAGGGLALALASDVRVASASARFNVAFVRLGLSGCDVGVSYFLPRIVGATRAAEMMLTGRLVDAEEAERIGLVLSTVPDGEAVAAALEVAERIAANSPFGVWMTKEVWSRNLDAPSLEAAIDLENRTQVMTLLTRDTREAVQAFGEKRPAVFTNT